jgi:hypothetical protein
MLMEEAVKKWASAQLASMIQNGYSTKMAHLGGLPTASDVKISSLSVYEGWPGRFGRFC